MKQEIYFIEGLPAVTPFMWYYPRIGGFFSVDHWYRW